MDLRFYGKLFVRRLPYLLLLFALGSAIGVTLATVLPPVYIARAVLIVESQQIPNDLAATTVEVSALEQLQIIEQRILTRASLIDMANRLRVYAPRPGEPAAAPMAADAIVADMRRRIRIATTGSGPNTRGPAQATIVTVSFEAPSAQLSAAVTNEIVTMILAENVSIRTTVASDTLRFFVSEVARLEQELTRVGAEILAFQEANLDALPDSLDFRRSQQAAAQERLLDVQRSETALRDRRETLIQLYETTGAVPDPAPQSETAEARQLRALRDELSAALAILSPQNPRVRLLEQQVAQLEATVAAQAAGSVPTPSGPAPSPLDVQLADIDAQLRFLAEQRAQIEATLAALTSSIERTPANAIRLDTLQRDYANLRAQYDQAVASRALAETGEMIETLAKGQRISVIEQATPPAAPDSPNRPLIAAAGIGGGLAAGLGLILLMELLNTAVRRPADLTARLGITPLATLPLMRTARETWRRRAIIALAFSIALVAIPAGLWVVHTRVTPLDLLFDRVFEQLGVAPPDFLSPA